jgi:hypothetical protein
MGACVRLQTLRACHPQAGAGFTLEPTLLTQTDGPPPPGWSATPPGVRVVHHFCNLQLGVFEQTLLRQPGCELQFLCMRVGDPVSGRLHWPRHAVMTLDGERLRIPCRALEDDLPLSGVDAHARMDPTARVGNVMRMSFAGYDTRMFAVAVRVARPKTFDEVRSDMQRPLSIRHAASDVVSWFANNQCGVPVQSVTISLRDPISGNRIKTPVRFKGCTNLDVFDLDVFLKIAQLSRRWLCPRCCVRGSPCELRKDSYLELVFQALDSTDATDVLLDKSGSWRAVYPRVGRMHEIGVRFGRLVTQLETLHAAEMGCKLDL